MAAYAGHLWQGLVATSNVAPWERWVSLAAGGGLVLDGLRRGSLLRLAVGGGLLARGATGHCPVYRALGVDSAAEPRHGRWVAVPAGHGIRVDERIQIRRALADVFEFWRNLENLPRVMDHLHSVERVGTSRTHWVAKGLLGRTAQWDAELINQRPNELIAWRSLPGGDIDMAGSVRFSPSPDGFGTMVHVELKYDPPGGRLGATLAWLLGDDPRTQIRQDLTRLKDLLEGEDDTAGSASHATARPGTGHSGTGHPGSRKAK
ncbi:MAG TPA: SRPBCC family protein [Pirellulales bacterium]|jgi:uncharacterized membrane protein|nr:SRPBCC family protein [Pirellulales bacterium]